MLICYGLTSRGGIAAMTFGKAFESDSHAKLEYITTGRALVEMSYHTNSLFENSPVNAPTSKPVQAHADSPFE
jgi:hypothetical protein